MKLWYAYSRYHDQEVSMFEELKRQHPEFSQFDMDELYSLVDGDLDEIEAICQLAHYLELDSVVATFHRMNELEEMVAGMKAGGSKRYRCSYCGQVNLFPNDCTCDEWKRQGEEFDQLIKGTDLRM